MSDICYFIGGPLDLTKTVKQTAESVLIAIEQVAFTVAELTSNRSIPMRKHTYLRLPRYGPPIVGVSQQPFIYIYSGIDD